MLNLFIIIIIKYNRVIIRLALLEFVCPWITLRIYGYVGNIIYIIDFFHMFYLCWFRANIRHAYDIALWYNFEFIAFNIIFCSRVIILLVFDVIIV